MYHPCHAANPVLMDRHTGIPLSDPVFEVAAGPAAEDTIRWRIAAALARKSRGATLTDEGAKIQ